MTEITISFVHTEGPGEGLKAIRAVEKVLARFGFQPLDHGTNFKNKGDATVYAGSDTTVERNARVGKTELSQMKVAVRGALKKSGVFLFKMGQDE